MKNLKKVILLSLVMSSALVLSACSISTKSDSSQGSGNIFVSSDKGSTWMQASAVPSLSGVAASIAGVEVKGFFKDSLDHSAVYLATKSNGLYYTYNVSKGWNKANLSETSVNSVAVDDKNKCQLYVAAANKLYGSTDCSRSFQQIYYDNTSTVSIDNVVVDFYNPRNVYITTSRGEVIKSIDYGESWRTIWRFEEPIEKLILSPLDSRRIFVVTKSNMIYSFVSNTDTDVSRSAEIDSNFQASNFKDLNAPLNDMEIGDDFANLTASNNGDIFFVTGSIILKSIDDGISWEKISLIQAEKDNNILAFAVNPKNSSEIYYATATTFFRSADAGVTWTSRRLPTTWQASDILVDFYDTNSVYLGTEKVPDEGGSGFLQIK